MKVYLEHSLLITLALKRSMLTLGSSLFEFSDVLKIHGNYLIPSKLKWWQFLCRNVSINVIGSVSRQDETNPVF